MAYHQNFWHSFLHPLLAINSMNEKLIQAQIAMLVMQRDNALNTCVNLMGDLAVARDRVAELEAKAAMLQAIADAANLAGIEVAALPAAA